MTLDLVALAGGLALLQLLTVGALWGALARARRLRRRAAEAEDLADDIALLVENGRVVAATPGARAALGDVRGRRARAVLERLLGACGAGPALAALERLERTGEPITLAVPDAEGRLWELHGAPRGARLRLALREVPEKEGQRPRATAAGLRAPAPEPLPAAAQVADPVADPSPPAPAAAALAALADARCLTVWRRAADGAVLWTAGAVTTAHGTVGAPAAAEAAARAARAAATRGAGAAEAAMRSEPVRFRIEASPEGGGPTAVLEAVELRDAEGAATGFAVDAGALVAAEQTLARFVRTMTETFAHLNVGLAIFDRGQRLILFNPAVAEMWRADPAWLARRPTLRDVLDLLRANRRLPEVPDFHLWRQRLTGLFDNPETADFEELWHLADGSDLRVLARPHPQGSLAFVFDDVTEHLRLEQRYRHEVDVRRVTLDRLAEGLAVFRPDGRLQFVNAAFHAIWGTDEDAVRPEMHVRELMPLVAGIAVEREVWARLVTFVAGEESRDPWSARLTLGSGRVLDARVAALPDGSTMAVFTDITDSERIEQAFGERNAALEAAEEIRAAVLDHISYRLRTPLNTIFGFGQLLVDPRFGTLSDTQRQYAEQILESARSLIATVDEITGLAALEAAPVDEAETRPPVVEAMQFIARLLEKRAAGAGVGLRIEIPDAPAAEAMRAPACDAATLRQLMFRMTAEAVDASAAGSEVTLGARTGEGGAPELYVRMTPAAAETPMAGVRARGAQLRHLERLAARAGGTLVLDARPAGGVIETVCRLTPGPDDRDAAAPGARAAPGAEDAGRARTGPDGPGQAHGRAARR